MTCSWGLSGNAQDDKVEGSCDASTSRPSPHGGAEGVLRRVGLRGKAGAPGGSSRKALLGAFSPNSVTTLGVLTVDVKHWV